MPPLCFRRVARVRRLLSLLSLVLSASLRLFAEEFDVLVYGATPAGIAAALSAGRAGDRVLLVEPTGRVGGMMTNGLSHTDLRTFEAVTGFYRETSRRIEAHYRDAFGAESAQLRDCMHGTQAEPKVALAVFEAMLAEVPKVRVRKRWILENVKCSTGGSEEPDPVRSAEIALFLDEEGERRSVAAHYFIDATYEGDLLAAARIPYRLGREARALFNESLAPEKEDDQLQAYNFRLILTREEENRAPVPEPAGYERELFLGILPLLKTGKIGRVFDMKPPAVFKAHTPGLPNGKFDVNDVSQSLVRLSLPGENLAWADGDAGVAIRSGSERDTLVAPFSRLGLAIPRQRIFDAHVLWNVGLLYFLQNDQAVPEKIRQEVAGWGLAKDEFVQSRNLPEQLYVREARRMIGTYVYTQQDTEAAEGDVRAGFHEDAVAMGDYGPNCHGTGHEGGRFSGRHVGEFYQVAPPYQIPYGVLLPRKVDNLLSACAVSASHVGFCALRFEPVWMSLGEAAGHAAHLANAAKSTVHQVPPAAIRKRLHATGAATLYVSDVPAGHPDFSAVQWWGGLGGLHWLYPASAKPGQRGANIVGQYFEAFPFHAAALDQVLSAQLAAHWLGIAQEAKLNPASLPAADGKVTRGDWIRAAFAIAAH